MSMRCYGTAANLSATVSRSESMSTATTEPPPTPPCVFARMDTANNLLAIGRKGRRTVRTEFD